MSMVLGQLTAGKRTEKPVLVSTVVTHLSGLGPNTISLVERLTSVVGKQFCTRSPHMRGLTKVRATVASRSRSEDALPVASARGCGEARITTCNPIAACS